jgi:hypothetical protein
MKNMAAPKHKGLKTENFDEKRGNLKQKGIKTKTSNKMHEGDLANPKSRTVSSPKIASPN